MHHRARTVALQLTDLHAPKQQRFVNAA